MFNLELRLLGTQLLELRLGRQRGERTDGWREEPQPYAWVGGQPLTMQETFAIIRDAQEADADDELGNGIELDDDDHDDDESEGSEPHEWIGCQFPLIAYAPEADEDHELGDGIDLDEEWAIFGRDDDKEDGGEERQ